MIKDKNMLRECTTRSLLPPTPSIHTFSTPTKTGQVAHK